MSLTLTRGGGRDGRMENSRPVWAIYDFQVRESRAGERAQLVKYLPCTHEGLSSDPQHLSKNPGVIKCI